MSTTPRTSTTSAALAGRSTYRVAIVGAASVKGKEVAQVITDRNFPASDIKLLDEEEALGQLETAGDEVTFIQNVSPEQFERVDFTFFIADQASTRKHWKAARNAGSTLIDLTAELAGQPDAAMRAPWVERQRGESPVLQLQPGPAVIAHPAAIVLALLFLRLQKAGLASHPVVTILEPASERGQKGMDELHEQTVNLLSFRPLPKKVFDIQIAFNMVSRYGQEASPSLTSIQERILHDYRRIAGEAPVPSVFLAQAPIFHGYAFALHIKMKEQTRVEDVVQALTGEHVSVTTGSDEAPSNVNAAGHGDILVSVAADLNQTGAFWLWAAADNLRVAASNAVECAETMAASRPQGKIQ